MKTRLAVAVVSVVVLTMQAQAAQRAPRAAPRCSALLEDIGKWEKVARDAGMQKQ